MIKMKKILYSLLAITLLAACDKDRFQYGEEYGTLSFDGAGLTVSEEINPTKADAVSEE